MSEFDWDKLSNEIAKSTDPLPVLRADQESRWLYGDQPAAEDYIRQFPELSDDATLVLILAEMSLRSRLGETVVMADFQRRFPKFASDLPIQWAVLSAIDSGTPAVTTRQSDRLPVSSLLPPQESGEIGRVPGYRIFEQIGQGAMGVVFRAEDLVLKRIVAIKMMKPEIAESLEHRQRFLREAQAAARLDHPHIVPIFHVGDHCGVPFLVMPLLRGESLRRQMSRTGCSVTEAVETVRQVAEGLEAAHRQGMTHRDVKPDNIWRDESGVCKLLDFGLSRIPSEDALATQSGLILGTPAYMAPEQARGEHVGPRSDLFSLGVVLYELLTGRRPFAGRNAMEVLSNVITEQPASPDKINPAVPAALARLCMRLLGKNPDDRISSAAEVIDCLRKFTGPCPSAAYRVTWTGQFPMALDRRRSERSSAGQSGCLHQCAGER